MNADEIRQAAQRSDFRSKAGPLLAMMGMAIVVTTLVIRIVIAVTAADYYALDLVTRDTALSGSTILNDLSVINTWPLWTLPCGFLGLATLMVGIALIFSTIPGRIQQRASAMALTLPRVIESRQGTK